MSKLEKAARNYIDKYYADEEYPSEIKDIVNDSEQSFIAGAEWQKYNTWISINDRDNVIPNDKDVLIRMSNGEVRRYDEDWESEFALDSVTHWMLIPEYDVND